MKSVRRLLKRRVKKGCVVIRKIWLDAKDADYVCRTWNVPGCRTVLCVVREVWKIAVPISYEVRYFVSSLDASQVSAERFLELVAGHWQVENCLHLVKDRWRDEDKHLFRRLGLEEIWSALTSCALSLLHCWKEAKEKITKTALYVAHQPRIFLKLLGF